MALVSLEQWRKTTFEEPRPTLRSCQRWAAQGHIAGAKKVGALWFVDEALSKQAHTNTLVGKVLAG